MQRALVTGGCGFLGSWIVRTLVDEGVTVRVLALPGERRDNLEGVPCEIVEGDVTSVVDVERAVAGVDTVFHAAAIYADWAPDPTRMYDVNLRGTFHVLEASRRAGVSKVIVTASIVSLGRPGPGEIADETTPFESWELDFPYARSKFLSRELAEYFAAWGLDVRVVCPGIVLGPGDLRPTPSGALVLTTARLPGPALVFEGGASYVDVRDAAAVHVLAARHGRAGQRYLAAAHNLTNLALVRAIVYALGRRRPVVRLPVFVARIATTVMAWWARRTGQPPMLARVFFEYSLRPSVHSSEKAIRELGARFRPIEASLADAVAWFRARGMLPPS